MNTLKFFYVSFVLSLSMWANPGTASAQGGAVSYQVFYDQLSPYGQWENDPNYGYVWSPYVAGFSPYSTNGYWVYTDYCWTWVSNYPWGWAPFHYGRWNRKGGNRWVWVPDNVWGPAWVEWRNSPGYYGWAPLGYGNNEDYYRWNFVTYSNFGRQDIHNYYITKSKNVIIIKNSTVLNGAGGPSIDDAQKHSGKKFNPVKIESYDKPGQSITKDKYNIYRPQVEKNGAGAKPAAVKASTPKQNAGANGGMDKPQQPKQNASNGGIYKPQPQQPKQNAGGNGTMKPIQQPKQNPTNAGGMNMPKQQPKQSPANAGGMNMPQQPMQQPDNNGGGMNKPQMQPKQSPANSGGMNKANQQPNSNGGGKGKQPKK